MAKGKGGSNAGASPGRRPFDPVVDLTEVQLSIVQGYDPYGFYIDSTDGKGHSRAVHTKVTPQFYRDLEVVRDEQSQVYRTMGDLVRDCLYHGLYHICRRVKRPIPSSILWESYMTELREQRQALRMGEAAAKEAAAALREAVQRQERVAAEEILADVRLRCAMDTNRVVATHTWRVFVREVQDAVQPLGWVLDPNDVPGGEVKV